MTVQVSLTESVQNAISAHLAGEESPAMMTSFLLVTSSIDSNGHTFVRANHPEDQPLHVSLGLASFGAEWIKDDIQNAFYAPRGDED